MITKKGLPVAKWAEIKEQTTKNSLAAISTQGPLMQSAHQWEACIELPVSGTELPACAVLLPAEPALVKEFLETYFKQ